MKTRQVLRAAGWLAILAGLTSMAVAMFVDADVASLAGGYGVLFVAAGGWIVGGLHVLAWRERSAPAQARARASKTTESLSR